MSSIKLHKNIKWNPFYRNIKISPSKYENIINIEGFDYELRYLNEQYKSSKGGNSNVFILANPDDSKVEEEEIIIKISNIPIEKSNQKYQRRFDREIIALRKAKKANKKFIIKYQYHGVLLINDLRNNYFQFPFYTMEKADEDLSNYLLKDIEVSQKILLCLSIIKGFKELHDLEIYHRDIKHDNIFLISRECRIGDLGLMRFRDDDLDFIKTEVGERIGAFGWESPETMNKYLTENNERLSYDCEIDTKSDIFQLGKLFWYIFQGNLPIGQVKYEDFLIQDNKLFELIFKMLQYSKAEDRRLQNINQVEALLIPIAKEKELI